MLIHGVVVFEVGSSAVASLKGQLCDTMSLTELEVSRLLMAATLLAKPGLLVPYFLRCMTFGVGSVIAHLISLFMHNPYLDSDVFFSVLAYGESPQKGILVCAKKNLPPFFAPPLSLHFGGASFGPLFFGPV